MAHAALTVITHPVGHPAPWVLIKAQLVGAAIEFYCPEAIDLALVRRVLPILPCGDVHP